MAVSYEHFQTASSLLFVRILIAGLQSLRGISWQSSYASLTEELWAISFIVMTSYLFFLATYLAAMPIFSNACAAWVSSEISIKCVGASHSFPPPLPFFIMRSCGILKVINQLYVSLIVHVVWLFHCQIRKQTWPHALSIMSGRFYMEFYKWYMWYIPPVWTNRISAFVTTRI